MEIILTAILLLTVNFLSLIVYRAIVRRRQRGADARDRLRELAAMDHLSPDPQPPELHVVRACDAVVARPAGSPWASVRVTPAALGLVGAATVFVLSSSGVGAPGGVVQPNAALPPTTAQIPDVDTTPPATITAPAPALTTQSLAAAARTAATTDDPDSLQITAHSPSPRAASTVPPSDRQPPPPRQEPVSSSSASTPSSRQPLCAGAVQARALPVACPIG